MLSRGIRGTQKRTATVAFLQQARGVTYQSLDVPWIPESPPMKFVGPNQNIPVEDAPTLEEWRKTNDDPLKHMTAAERNAYVDGNRGWSPIFKRQPGWRYSPDMGHYGRWTEPGQNDWFGQLIAQPKQFVELTIGHFDAIWPRWIRHLAIVLPGAYYLNYNKRVEVLLDKAERDYFLNGGRTPLQYKKEEIPY